MTLSAAAKKLVTSRPALAGVAALGALALANRAAARRAEREHPPKGKFIEVDGVRLHYTDRGAGQPIVLVHGNAVAGDDWNTSGVADLLLRDGHRVIVFDRPGFGHSERPRGRLWTAMQQAELLHKALRQLGIERPVVVGHSWGAIVALSLAARHPADTEGLVLLSGYYFWPLRPDVLLVAAGAIPVLGDILRYTVSPWLGQLLMPLQKRAVFSMEAVRTIRADRKIEGADPGIARATGQVTARFADTALLTQASNGTAAELAFAFTIDANRSLTFTPHEVYLALAKTPLEGPAGVEASSEFRAAFNATATRMMTAVLKNQQQATEYA